MNLESGDLALTSWSAVNKQLNEKSQEPISRQQQQQQQLPWV